MKITFTFCNKMAFLCLLLSINGFFAMAQTTFSDEQIISTNADGASSVYAIDLDNDGDIDVLSASGYDTKIAWYENDGFGNFSTEQIISTNALGANFVYAIDLDNDGDVDVLSASSLDDKIAWYANDGLGNFSTEQIISTDANNAYSVYAIDLDNDGDIDVLSASALDDKIAWYANDGLGNFSTEQIISTNAEGARSVYAVDLDNDGDVDVLSASAIDDKIAWYANDGLGNFSTEQIISTDAENPRSVYAIDLDNDGDVDVLSASLDDDKIAWYENDGLGNFGNQQVISINAVNAISVYAIDLDNDGDIDVLSASYSDHKIAWYENDGLGNFTTEQIISTNALGANFVYAIDLDNDGDVDVLSASSLDDKIAWYENLLALNMLVYENNPPCLGSNTGSLQVVLSGLTYPPYTYTWHDGTNTFTGTSTTEDFIISDLTAGVYSITVTNIDGDEVIETDIELTGIAGSFFEIIDITSTNSTNELPNGSLQISIDGGNAPYTYAWSGTAFGNETIDETVYNIPNLYAGNYDITVTDVDGNTAQHTATLLDETVPVSTCENPLDLIILNDVSGSVDDIEYAESKQFFVDFINALNVGTAADESRVGIIEWSDNQDLTIPITGDLAVLQNYVNNTRAFNDGTYPQGALTYGHDYLEAEARPNVPKVLVLSTDAGQSQVSGSLISLAQTYQAEGYIIVSVAFDTAFSNSFTQSILQQVASLDVLAPGASAYSLLNNDLAENIVNIYVCPLDPGSSNTVYFNRDGVLEILSYTPNDFCPNPENITLEINVSAEQQLSLPAGTPISFYANNPALFSATPISTYYIPCAIAAGESEIVEVTLPVSGPTNVWAVLNDDGTQSPPISLPITDIEETIYLNNLDNISVCTDPLPTLVATKYTTTPIPICDTIVIYTVDVCNISNLSATEVIITDDAPNNFELLNTSINDNACATGNLTDGFNLAGGCCVSITYEYDASAANNGFYNNQDVLLSGIGGQIYNNFDGVTTSAEDVTIGEINCDSDVVLFSKNVNITEICEESFVSYTFTIDNQTDVALQNLSFSDILPPPVIWAAEPYFLDGLSIGTTNITGNQTADFTIAQVEAQTVATFVLDAYLSSWNTSGILENTATLDDLPDFINGNGNAIAAVSENVNVYSNPNISTDNFISIYENETATLTANIGEGINPIWTTASDGILTTPNDVTTIYIPSESDIENGFVQFGISTDSPLGCGEANDTVYLEILPLPDLLLNFSADTLQICENECINLTDLSISESTITSFEWQLAGSETPISTEQNPEVCYTAAGTYDIALIAATDFAADTLLFTDYITVLDCTEPIDTTITEPIDTIITEPIDTIVIDTTTVINIKPATLIPNAFSPNNDGVNDEFGIAFSNENISDFHIMVYNRWGNEVFRSSDINNKWNGTYRNENCEIGLYVYFMSFNIDGIKEQHKGNVTLIR